MSGALIAPLIFGWTRNLTHDAVSAIAAGLIAAISGELLQLSISIMADALALMWSLVSVLALLRYTRVRRLLDVAQHRQR